MYTIIYDKNKFQAVKLTKKLRGKELTPILSDLEVTHSNNDWAIQVIENAFDIVYNLTDNEVRAERTATALNSLLKTTA